MYYVYVLESESGLLYIGYTNDLRRRFSEHNSGMCKSTKNNVWHVVYYESYNSKIDAMTRERRLKQDGRAKHQLLKRLLNSFSYYKVSVG